MHVSPLSFGAAEIGFERCSNKAVSALLRLALESGLNAINTEEMLRGSQGKDLAGPCVVSERIVGMFTPMRTFLCGLL